MTLCIAVEDHQSMTCIFYHAVFFITWTDSLLKSLWKAWRKSLVIIATNSNCAVTGKLLLSGSNKTSWPWLHAKNIWKTCISVRIWKLCYYSSHLFLKFIADESSNRLTSAKFWLFQIPHLWYYFHCHVFNSMITACQLFYIYIDLCFMWLCCVYFCRLANP